MSSLARPEKQLLLEVARASLIAAVEGRRILTEPPGSENLRMRAGAFVTLRLRGRLRGCVGQIEPIEPLVTVVHRVARSAALEDPRFSPVRSDEARELDIELSVLTHLGQIAPTAVEPGIHGLIISRGALRGVLLPQVAAERQWNAERFLEETCVKAGLERDAWKDTRTRIEAFTAEVFSESEMSATARPAGARARQLE
jgi:AmmeMemoRadiSam system protein A